MLHLSKVYNSLDQELQKTPKQLLHITAVIEKPTLRSQVCPSKIHLTLSKSKFGTEESMQDILQQLNRMDGRLENKIK